MLRFLKMLQENIETKVHTETETMKTTSEIGLSPAASEYVLLLYLKIKDGLVATDEGTVHQFSIEFEDIIRSEGSEAASPRLLSSAKDMMEIKNIEAQRKQFAILSQEMYALLKVHKPEGMTLYKQFCPMAFDKKGAYWISDIPTILNPYFGAKMLHSGKIQEEF